MVYVLPINGCNHLFVTYPKINMPYISCWIGSRTNGGFTPCYEALRHCGEAFLVMVTDEFIESREMAQKKMNQKGEKFEIGQCVFKNLGALK